MVGEGKITVEEAFCLLAADGAGGVAKAVTANGHLERRAWSRKRHHRQPRAAGRLR